MIGSNFIKQQIMFEILKHSAKSALKRKGRDLKEKFKKSKIKKGLDSLKHKYDKSEAKNIVDSGAENVNKKYNEVVYYIKNGKSIEFKEVDMTYDNILKLFEDGEFKFEDGLSLKIDDTEYFTFKTYYLLRESVIFLMREKFYENENIKLKLI
jgi:hypothetical protein